MSARLNAATAEARATLRQELIAAIGAVGYISRTYPGSILQLEACDRIVEQVAALSDTAAQLAALAHANASEYHGQEGRESLEQALRRWSA